MYTYKEYLDRLNKERKRGNLYNENTYKQVYESLFEILDAKGIRRTYKEKRKRRKGFEKPLLF